ncbi:MAG: lysophospholipid acyltransferase family protein [Bacteroidales bacterium]|nr:lysophospholipid acyltransferase family protein [Bacteroidales bacterium]MBQ9722638.1 lysophospholipid acyltransferase family protein [Bacteroidales bacterium]
MNELFAKIIRGCMVCLGKLPLKFHYFMGDILSWIAEKLLRYRTDVVWINISRSFPEMKYKELKKVYRDFYRHFGEIFAETIWFAAASYKRLFKSGIVTVTNPEEINEIFLSTPSMTVLSTHCGNWELMGGFLGYRTSADVKVAIEEEQIQVVYKKLSNPVSDEVFRRNRVAALEIVGTSCEIESSNILRQTLKQKDERKVYIYPTDQAPYKKAGKHPIGEFMSQPTNVMLGSVGVACKLSHSVMYMKMKRVERGRYEMTLIPICRDASQLTPEELMRKYYDLLEEEIRETPANWLWTHKRWK